MNKKEKETIFNQYQRIFSTNLSGIDKEDSIREFSSLLDQLSMRKERYIVENEIISKHRSYSPIVIDMFEMIFKDFSKYGVFINFDLDEAEDMLMNLEFTLTDEEYKYNTKRIAIIKDHIEKTA